LAKPDGPVVREEVWRLARGALSREEAHVIVEEPLQIVVDGVPYAALMRTPGADLELAAGFCLAEGLLEGPQELGSIQHCELEAADQVAVTRSGRRAAEAIARPARLTSGTSCGLCGRELVEDVFRRTEPITRACRIPLASLLSWGERLRDAQRYFGPTGGTHAAALFGEEGELLAAAEDVGRHNALDKAIGRLLLADRLGEACAAMLSGRVSFEMVQKAARAGIPVVAGLSAPTHLAIQLARRIGLTLVGFVRQDSLTVYTDAGRITDLPHIAQAG